MTLENNKMLINATKTAKILNAGKSFCPPIAPIKKSFNDCIDEIYNDEKSITVEGLKMNILDKSFIKSYIDFDILCMGLSADCEHCDEWKPMKNLTLVRCFSTKPKQFSTCKAFKGDKSGLFGASCATNFEAYGQYFGNMFIETDMFGKEQKFVKTNHAWKNENGKNDCNIAFEDELKKEIGVLKSRLICHVYSFDGRLKRIEDCNKNFIEIRYIEGTCLIEKIVSSCGKSLLFQYKDDKISEITDNIGRLVKYFYDEDYLTKIEQANGGIWHVRYKENSSSGFKILCEIVDPNGNIDVKIDYDRKDVPQKLYKNMSESWKLKFDERTQTVNFDLLDAKTNQTKPAFSIKHDRTGIIREINIANKKTIAYFYDEKNQLIQKKDSVLGDIFCINTSNSNIVFELDKRGNLTQKRETSSVGTIKVTAFELDALGRVTKVINSSKNATIYEYKTENSVLPEVIEFANGFRLEREYDEVSRIVRENNMGVIVKYVYNSADNIVQIVNEKTLQTQFMRYDFLGNLLEVMSPKEYKEAKETNRTGGKFRYSYDEKYNLQHIKKPDGTLYFKENCSDLKQYTQKHLIEADTLTDPGFKALEHDNRGNISRIQKISGGYTKLFYTGIDRLSKRTTRINENTEYITTFVYNDCGLLSEMIEWLDFSDADLNKIQLDFSKISAIPIKTLFNYDEDNNLEKIILPDGTIFEASFDISDNNSSENNCNGNNETPIDECACLYDKSGRILKKSYEDGTFETFEYDFADNVIKWTNREGFTTIFTFNSINRLKGKVEENGILTKYLYNHFGNLTNEVRNGS